MSYRKNADGADEQQRITPSKTPQLLTYCGKPVVAHCDHHCDKAWGRNSRPTKQLSENPDDYVFLPDSSLGAAPFPSLTTEDDEGKPDEHYYQGVYNKWCVRECERLIMIDVELPLLGIPDLVLPDLEHPQPNIKR